MHRIARPRRSIITAAAVAGCSIAVTATALGAPVTGSGQPIVTEQPSLGVTYLIRTDAANLADFGQVVAFAGNFAPGGYSVADGQTLSIAANEVLFSEIGATYGGNGTSTFALPNPEGRTVVGTGTVLTPRALGSVAGATTQTLTAGQLPVYGGATGVTAGGAPLPTTQPSIALTQSLVTQGYFPQSTGPQAQGPIVGQVLTYAGPTIPNGQIAANGQQLLVAQNSALFSVLGNTYGGNYPTTFVAPNLSGRAATEAGAGPGLTPQALGQTEGAQSTVLTLANLPPQPLTLPNGTTSVLGGDQPFGVQDPALGLHYIIDEQGVLPSQSGVVPDGEPFLGEISLFAGTTAPAGWAFADGQLLSIAQNEALFSVIGSTYGGNGVFDFALPDLMDRVAVGTGDGVTLGEMFGSDSDTLNFAQLPEGYPTVPALNNVPEPPARTILMSGLAALLCLARGRSSSRRVRSYTGCLHHGGATRRSTLQQCFYVIFHMVQHARRNGIRASL
jgi:microcystin-dependent protein